MALQGKSLAYLLVVQIVVIVIYNAILKLLGNRTARLLTRDPPYGDSSADSTFGNVQSMFQVQSPCNVTKGRVFLVEESDYEFLVLL